MLFGFWNPDLKEVELLFEFTLYVHSGELADVLVVVSEDVGALGVRTDQFALYVVDVSEIVAEHLVDLVRGELVLAVWVD